MKDDDNVQAMEDDQEDTPEENMDETEYEEVRVVSKAEKDKMVEGQQKKKIEIAKIKVKLNILRDDLDKAVTSKDFVSAQDLQLEIGKYNLGKKFCSKFYNFFFFRWLGCEIDQLEWRTGPYGDSPICREKGEN